MIPYYIQQASSSDDVRDANIYITRGSCVKSNLNEMIINHIVNEMYEFCSEEYGHNITITSYDDFCDKYWQIKEIHIRGWYDIFRIYYFENDWIEWNISDYKEEIYNKYLHLCTDKNSY